MPSTDIIGVILAVAGIGGLLSIPVIRLTRRISD
jgi:hypothetical protein